MSSTTTNDTAPTPKSQPANSRSYDFQTERARAVTRGLVQAK